MTELKNCPSCGGELDDDGRCLYCKSKVYDLTDINIDLKSHDIIRMKLKNGDNTFVMDCYPTNVEFELTSEPYYAGRYEDGRVCRFLSRRETRVRLELVSR